MLSGALPFPDGDLMRLMKAITQKVPPRLPDSIPITIQQVIWTALQKNPSSRFRSAADMKGALRDALRSSAKPIAPSSRSQPKAQARPAASNRHPASSMGSDVSPSASGPTLSDRAAPPQPPPLSNNPLHALWDCLDPNLQDAFALAYNKKRRDGSTRISTRDFFQALLRIQDDALQALLESLPEGALPEAAPANVSPAPELLAEDPLLSDCIADSLNHFEAMQPLPRKLSPADVFVDVAKHGHGPSVARLRQHGVGPVEVEDKVRTVGLSVLRRTCGS